MASASAKRRTGARSASAPSPTGPGSVRWLWMAWSGYPEYDNVNFIQGEVRLKSPPSGAP